jgi:hypothetical protein
VRALGTQWRDLISHPELWGDRGVVEIWNRSGTGSDAEALAAERAVALRWLSGTTALRLAAPLGHGDRVTPPPVLRAVIDSMPRLVSLSLGGPGASKGGWGKATIYRALALAPALRELAIPCSSGLGLAHLLDNSHIHTLHLIGGDALRIHGQVFPRVKVGIAESRERCTMTGLTLHIRAYYRCRTLGGWVLRRIGPDWCPWPGGLLVLTTSVLAFFR